MYKQYYSRIKENIYPALRKGPFFGPNIKRLKGEFNSIYRYRIGDYRLFYTIDFEKKLIFILDIIHRKDAYR
jgi:mRNA interferase RelE/StbE